MAKDPAFLFYPADASEDTQFMNRLERGCYFDLLKAQKKFGRFSLDQIKKVLGGDFDKCWAAIELVLTKDGDFYFIGWVAEKIEERKKFSESRRKNRQSKSLDKDMSNTSISNDDDMVIEDINAITDQNEFKGVEGEKGNRVIILAKYANERPVQVFDLRKHFASTGQLEAIERAGWIRFKEFMEFNPGATFNDREHLYNSFRKFNITPTNHQNATRKNTNSASILDEQKQYSDKF